MRKTSKAVILPHNKKLILWVTSPNGYWMLLSGHWTYRSECERYARAAGYTLTTESDAIASIEKQMHERADAGSEFASDVTRSDTRNVLKLKVH